MEIYDGPYFRINKKLMIYGGLWPYESRLRNIASRMYLGAGILIMTVPQMYGLYVNWGVHLDNVFEDIVHLIYLYALFLKLMIPLFAGETLKKVYESIAENWKSLTDPQEIRILAEYSQSGVVLTKGYIAYMLVAMSTYVALPLSPLLLNVIDPLINETRRPEFVMSGEFPVDDMYDHYIEIFLFDMIGCIIPVYVLIAVDPMYACCIEHCNGLFAIVKHRLKTCTVLVNIHDADVPYKKIVEIVKLHQKILDFAELLEETYSTFFLFIVGLAMVNVTLVSVIILVKQNKMFELVRYIGILVGMIVHLFYLSWPGQKLIDHSGGLFEDTYMSDWYNISQKAKILLLFMRLRCLTPCQLTAGSIYVMNIENFAAIMKTAGSYIAVFSSFAS